MSSPSHPESRPARWLVVAVTATLALALAAVQPAVAAEDPSLYNGDMPGNTHGGPNDDTPSTLTNDEVSQCINLADADLVPAWLIGGRNSNYRFDRLRWGPSGDPTCRDNQVRVQRLPSARISVGGQQREMYFQRGGAGDAPFGSDVNTTTRDSAIRHAHIWVADLAARPSVRDITNPNPSGGYPIYPNGRPCSATTVLYRTKPRPIPGYYKSLDEARRAGSTSNSGANWEKYGEASYTDGSQNGGVSYNYLLWNWKWLNGTGGGQVRVSMEGNTKIRRCDVTSISSPMYAKDSNDVIGTVRGVYGYVRDAAGAAHHGWFVHSFKLNSDAGWTNVVERADTLHTNETLPQDQTLVSDNGSYTLIPQGDGNLVLYGPSGPVWATNTFGPGSRLVMQLDGNLVLYANDGRVLWATNRFGSGARLVVQNDSNLVVYNSAGGVIWSRW
jgi:hypothetical protein